MPLDARSLPHDTVLQADICVVGAGAAGITVARELADSGLTVILAEGGGEEYDEDAQALYAGDSIGAEIDPAIARLRQFGGSTNHWGGRSRPFEAADFAPRTWIAHSGWPIDYAEFAAHLPRALALCEIEADDFTSPHVLPNALPFDPARVENGLWRFSPPTAFGTRYGPELGATSRLQVILHANLIDIRLNETCRKVERLAFATLTGIGLTVSCRFAVLACGGLENARLLLASRSQMSCGIGNARDLVGRFFMGHPVWDLMEVQLRPGARLPGIYHQMRRADGESEGMVRLGRALQAKLGTTCVDASFYAGGQFGTPGVRAARRLWRSVRRRTISDGLGRDIAILLGDLDGLAWAGMVRAGLVRPETSTVTVSMRVEQVPNPDSRVTLGEGRDALEQPTLLVDWRIGEQDRHGLVSFSRVLAEEIGRIGLGRALLADWLTDPEKPIPSHSNSAHHIGTTRMGADPSRGVVDRNCRVFGLDNLFVAGSSVFPTGGSVHPTLNIVAMAVRLAAHLRLVTRDGDGSSTAAGPN
ncbi:MAG TPA: GMC family oxidoreductase [Geminicoccaceae bacterium]|nr:GMC family oxidoreductase [Geminicoccus sp.]HMU52743.1 GMC family oxidoreductase [Geminicoccaceae bacterium]